MDCSFNSFASGLSHRIVVRRPDPDKAGKDDPNMAVTLSQMAFKQTQTTVKGQKREFASLDVAWHWRKALMKNRSLLHLDISHNQFKADDMEVIGDGLKENHTLLGLHAVGHNSEIDHNGFIQVKGASKAEDAVVQMQHFKRFDGKFIEHF